MNFLPIGITKGSDVSVLPKNRENGIAVFLQKILLILALTLFSFSIIPKNLLAQGGSSFYNPQDEKYLLLGLKRTKENYEYARKDFERNKALFEEGQIAQARYDESRKQYSAAEVDYQQQLLSIIFEKQYITISNAVKYSSETGAKIVRITLNNASSGSAELKKLVTFDEELFRALEPDVINNVYVSILNSDDAFIGQPYEHKIERLPANQPEEVSFTLLQDLDIITVFLIYGKDT